MDMNITMLWKRKKIGLYKLALAMRLRIGKWVQGVVVLPCVFILDYNR